MTLSGLMNSVGDDSDPKEKAIFVLAAALQDIVGQTAYVLPEVAATRALRRAHDLLCGDGEHPITGPSWDPSQEYVADPAKRRDVSA